MRTHQTMTISCAVLAVLLALPAFGASFVVPSDEWLIEQADAIVTGTVVASRTTTGATGSIETIHTLQIDERLKGFADGASEVEVVELGGRLGNQFLHVTGSPTYVPGGRYLVFLRRVGERWTTFDFLVGKFAFGTTETGLPVLARQEHVEGNGMDAPRPAAEFLARLRDAVRQGPRLEPKNGSMTSEGGSESGDVTLAAQIAAGNWSGDESSSIRYSVASDDATGELTGDDGEDRVIVGDPHDLIPGTLGVDSSVIAVAVYGCRAGGCLTVDDALSGVTYAGIDWADVVLNDVKPGLALNQPLLNTVLTHELGHTLGFRHSDRAKYDPVSGGATNHCEATLPCSSFAVMSAELNESLNGGLTEWDRNAANAVYGDGSRSAHRGDAWVDDLWVASRGEWLPARRETVDVAWKLANRVCETPVIVEHPASVDASEGSAATLSLTVTGSDLEFRWFEGESGDVSQPLAITTAPMLTIEPVRQSKTYWVLVVSSCESIATRAARITVREGCSSAELCALSNRFRVSLSARDHRTGATGPGVARSVNDLFGTFSLPALTGDQGNPEVFVKVLDGREVNGNFWTFYGGLTDLEYTLSVTDVDTGRTRTYHKAAGSSAGGVDVGNGVETETCGSEVDGLSRRMQSSELSCGGGTNALCLVSGRFNVVLEARDHRTGATGSGEANTQSDLSGYFSLPTLTGNSDNPEVFVKVLDGRPVNGHFWVFFSGMTDLEYSVIVTDVLTGAQRVYFKPGGSACGAFDTDGFDGS